MGRFSPSSSYNHHIRSAGGGDYWISWTIDRYYAGSRLRHPRVFERFTDEAGAKRFAKKWGAEMPA